MFTEDKKIGILFGGCSCEREVSIKSGKAVAKAFESLEYDAVLLDVQRETELEIVSLLKNNRIDIVFIAMHGGFGEDGRLQNILERLEVPYTGSSFRASRIAMDKLASRLIFEEAGLCVPRYVRLKKEDNISATEALRYPLVVKPSRQGSSIGISFVDSASVLEKAVQDAFAFDEEILAEEFIRGRELTVSVLDGKPLPIVEIIPKTGFFDYKSKYEPGWTHYIVPAPLAPDIVEEVQACAVRAYEALGCRHFARVDMIVQVEHAPFILEVNTIPGLTETSLFPKAAQAAGISFDLLCKKLIQMPLTDLVKG